MLQILLGIFLAAVLFIFGLVLYNKTQAELVVAQARADAILIDARTTAFVDKAFAMLPWGILVAIGIPSTILALKWQPKRVIKNEITFHIEAPRREVWKQMEKQAREIIDIRK